jgi:hypothetical protein
MDGQRQRFVQNEDLFRRANERLREDWGRLGIERASQAMFLCECGDTACRDPIRIRITDYEAVRSDPDAYMLVPGHQDDAVETVIGEHRRFLVVHKH